MKLNVPSGVTSLFDDGGNLLPIVNGQVDVQPHLINALLAQDYVVAGADNLTSDAPLPSTSASESE